LQRACGGESFGNEFRRRAGEGLQGDFVKIDFVQNARSLGAVAMRAETEETLRDALAAARRESRTTLIHVPVEARPLPGYAWWDVPVAEVSEQEAVQAARRRYLEARKQQRFHY
jgi:3D-(3,5/4)-trihydroxycyclohexane-1,2-dione acylhydrolase (decyclizing)